MIVIPSFSFVAGARTRATLLALALLGMAGCAQVSSLKTRVSDSFSGKDASAASGATAEGAEPLPLSAITSSYLMRGRYEEGEQRLRQYLAKYPSDRAAQAMLRQLTVDPKLALGSRSRSYTVQAGDTYGTLAARQLGDSTLFLVLARYNGSSNPSSLRAGEAIRLPTASRANLEAGTRPAPRGGAAAGSAVSSAAAPANAAPAADAPSVRAQKLQAESNALLKQGQKEQALARLDQALTLDPQLKPAGNQALREQLLSSYHERAVVLYRDQKLEQAIALWDHVLAIDPGYERATIYRARAIELQHRLKQI